MDGLLVFLRVFFVFLGVWVGGFVDGCLRLGFGCRGFLVRFFYCFVLNFGVLLFRGCVGLGFVFGILFGKMDLNFVVVVLGCVLYVLRRLVFFVVLND